MLFANIFREVFWRFLICHVTWFGNFLNIEFHVKSGCCSNMNQTYDYSDKRISEEWVSVKTVEGILLLCWNLHKYITVTISTEKCLHVPRVKSTSLQAFWLIINVTMELYWIKIKMLKNHNYTPLEVYLPSNMFSCTVWLNFFPMVSQNSLTQNKGKESENSY